MQANAAELATLKQLNIKWTHENTNQCTQTHTHTHREQLITVIHRHVTINGISNANTHNDLTYTWLIMMEICQKKDRSVIIQLQTCLDTEAQVIIDIDILSIHYSYWYLSFLGA